MPRRRKVAKRRTDRLTDRQREILLHGFDFGPAFGDGFASDADEQVAWELHREQLLAEFAAERPDFWRPVAWWKYEAPEPRNADEPEPVQLGRLGVLTPEERAR